MSTIIKYKIIEGTIDTLPDKVNFWIKDGWELQGGVTCCFAALGSLLAFQAMILKVNEVE